MEADSEKTEERETNKTEGGKGVRVRGCGKEHHEKKDESVR